MDVDHQREAFAGLTAELDALRCRVNNACPGPERRRRGSDAQALINLIALAPYADPTRLPLLKRHLDGSRAEWHPSRYPPSGAPWTPPRGVPVVRTPPRGIRSPRAPRSVDN